MNKKIFDKYKWFRYMSRPDTNFLTKTRARKPHIPLYKFIKGKDSSINFHLIPYQDKKRYNSLNYEIVLSRSGEYINLLLMTLNSKLFITIGTIEDLDLKKELSFLPLKEKDIRNILSISDEIWEMI